MNTNYKKDSKRSQNMTYIKLINFQINTTILDRV